MQRTEATFLLAIGLILGCATPGVVHKPTATVEAWGIAVMPFYFEYTTDDAESYTRALHISNHLARTTGKLIYGPGDFTLSSVEGNDLRKATDLATRVHWTEARTPETFVAIRLRASRTLHLGPESRTPIVTVKVRAELLSMAAPAVLASSEAQINMGTESQTVGTDTWPGLTHLTESLVDQLVEAAGWQPAKTRPRHGMEFITLPRAALDFHPPFSPQKKLVSLEREARLRTQIEQLDPSASDARRAVYLEEPYGLLVTGVAGAASRANLLAEDVLTDGNGDPLFGEYALLRQLHDGPVRLRLKRGGVALGTILNP